METRSGCSPDRSAAEEDPEVRASGPTPPAVTATDAVGGGAPPLVTRATTEAFA